MVAVKIIIKDIEVSFAVAASIVKISYPFIGGISSAIIGHNGIIAVGALCKHIILPVFSFSALHYGTITFFTAKRDKRRVGNLYSLDAYPYLFPFMVWYVLNSITQVL